VEIGHEVEFGGGFIHKNSGFRGSWPIVVKDHS